MSWLPLGAELLPGSGADHRNPCRPPARRDEDTDAHEVHPHDHERNLERERRTLSTSMIGNTENVMLSTVISSPDIARDLQPYRWPRHDAPQATNGIANITTYVSA